MATFVDDPTVKGALKYLKNIRDPQARGRMRREVANLQTLANAGGAVPRVLDHNTGQFEEVGTDLYVVMDLVPGPTLSAYVETHGPLAVDTAIRFILSLCETVRIAHSFPILHRDLKPDNIIVRDANVPTLIVVDYGLSFNIIDDDLTQTDETFRNRFLDLPETNTPTGDRRDPRSDLTAVCAVLYYSLTGKVPGQLQDGTGALPHMRRGHSLRDLVHDDRVAALEEFFTRGFAPNIANRYQQIEEIQEKLTGLLSTSQPLDESDPVQLATKLSNQLRARDRTTQIAEFRQQANVLFDRIAHEAGKYADKLKRFRLQNSGGFQPKMVIPDGLELVEHYPYVIILQAEHHPQQRHRRYCVASRGEQCVLLTGDYAANSQKPQDVAAFNLTFAPVAWYEGSPEAIFNLVSVSYRDWLTAQLKSLAQEILTGSQ